jgi:HSP20 family protein
VSISAEVKQEDRQAENGRLLRSERYFGRVSRSFELPGAVDTNASEANFTDGVLSLLLPKAEPKLKQHKIDIK